MSAIQHTHWPCLQVGNQQRANYLPMEVCKIVEGQRYSKRLNERLITALLKVTCQRSQEREKDIMQVVCHNAYYEARILPASRVNKLTHLHSHFRRAMELVFSFYIN
ncbi:hypothetical protein MKW92_004335 [Papaver armeniacum]|nr:hypothetical protein MKW92_004335 [Papaver armeniacum]